MKRKRWLRWIARGIGVAIAAFAVHSAFSFPWTETVRALEGTSVAILALAILANLVAIAARGWSWHLLLKPAAPNRLRIAQEATLIGAAIGNVSVAVAGEGTRARFISRRDGVPAGLAVASIVWSRVVEAIALVAFLLVVPFFLHRTAQITWLQIGAVAAVLVWTGYLALRRRFSLSRFVPGFLHNLLEPMREIPVDRRRLLWPTALALVYWLTQWATYHLALRASGLAIPPGASFAAVVIANVAWVFRFTPGNVGVMQGSIALALLPFGVRAGPAVAAGLVLQALQVVPVVLFAAGLTGIRGLHHLVSIEEAERPHG